MVEYTNLNSISRKELAELISENDGAYVISVVMCGNGDIRVLSPFDRPVTKHFILEAGTHMPVAEQ